jgi:hypothetical protein
VSDAEVNGNVVTNLVSLKTSDKDGYNAEWDGQGKSLLIQGSSTIESID